MPKLYAPNGRVIMPRSGIGDEVTTTEPLNPETPGTIAQGPLEQRGPLDADVADVEPLKPGRMTESAPPPDEGTLGWDAVGRGAQRSGDDPAEHGVDTSGHEVSDTTEPDEAVIGLPAPHPARPRNGLGMFGVVRGMIVQTYRRGVEIELMHRAFGFAALGFVTLVPLLIVVAAAAPLNGRTFPEWAVAGLGLSGKAAQAVNTLFGPTARVLSTTTAFSLAVLAVFGLSFVSVVQTGLARVWGLPVARLLSVWRQTVRLAALVGLLLVGADLLTLLHDGWVISTLRWLVTAAGATVFFWWTARFLLEGRVPWRALLPGAILTVGGLVGLRLFSAVIFSPLIVSSAVTYGAIGSVLIVVSWLIGIGYVIFGGALVGRALHDLWTGDGDDAE